MGAETSGSTGGKAAAGGTTAGGRQWFLWI